MKCIYINIALNGLFNGNVWVLISLISYSETSHNVQFYHMYSFIIQHILATHTAIMGKNCSSLLQESLQICKRICKKGLMHSSDFVTLSIY